MNQNLMQQICKKHEHNETMLFLLYNGLPTLNERNYDEEVKKNLVGGSTQNVQKLSMSYIQTQLLKSFDVDDLLMQSSKFLRASDIIADETLVLKDDIFVQYCLKALQHNSDYAQLFSKLILLPKINSLMGKVSEHLADAISQVFISHQYEVMESCFEILLSQKLQDNNYSEIFDHIFSRTVDKVDAEFLNTMIRILQKKSDIVEQDLQTFSVILKYMDLTNDFTQTVVLEFLEKCSPQFVKSIRFGRCLLNFLQTCPMNDRNESTINFIVASHKSSLRKAVEIQWSKAAKS